MTVAARLEELKARFISLIRRDPRRLRTALVTFVAAFASVLAGASMYVLMIAHGLPDEAAIRRIGDMDQATAVFDDHDQLAFTIFKEQRIERPLAEISPNLVR